MSQKQFSFRSNDDSSSDKQLQSTILQLQYVQHENTLNHCYHKVKDVEEQQIIG